MTHTAALGAKQPQSPDLLLVEDDDALRETTALVLEQHGFSVAATADGESALAVLERQLPDAIVLDVMLPGIDGISLTRSIRERALAVPIVLLTARDHPLDIVSGLEAGADDYVVKPFDSPVLAARLRAAIRRAAPPTADVRRHTIGDLEIDLAAMRVERSGTPLALTPTEMRLLTEFVTRRGVVLSRDQLVESVWGYDWVGDTRLVDVHIQRLRAKIGATAITTVRGYGYRFER